MQLTSGEIVQETRAFARAASLSRRSQLIAVLGGQSGAVTLEGE
jgi:hypothetical protein